MMKKTKPKVSNKKAPTLKSENLDILTPIKIEMDPFDIKIEQIEKHVKLEQIQPEINLKLDETLMMDTLMSTDKNKRFYLMEHPLTPMSSSYNLEDVENIRIKPDNRMIEMDIFLEDSSTLANTGYPKARTKKPRRRCRPFTEKEKELVLHKLSLRSVPGKKNYKHSLIVGRVSEGEMHLMPLQDYVKMRPKFWSKHDSTKLEKSCKVRRESHFQRQRRMRSRKWQDEITAAENWQTCSFNESQISLKPSEDQVTSDQQNIVNQMDFIKSLVRSHVPEYFLEMCSNVSWDIRAINYLKEIGKMTTIEKICKYLDKKIAPIEILRRLAYCSHVIQGYIVLKSEFIYVDTYRPYVSSCPMELLRVLRNYIFGFLSERGGRLISNSLHKASSVSLLECDKLLEQFDTLAIENNEIKIDMNCKFIVDSAKRVSELYKDASKVMDSGIRKLILMPGLNVRGMSSYKAVRDYSLIFGSDLDEKVEMKNGSF